MRQHKIRWSEKFLRHLFMQYPSHNVVRVDVDKQIDCIWL